MEVLNRSEKYKLLIILFPENKKKCFSFFFLSLKIILLSTHDAGDDGESEREWREKSSSAFTCFTMLFNKKLISYKITNSEEFLIANFFHFCCIKFPCLCSDWWLGARIQENVRERKTRKMLNCLDFYWCNLIN